MCFKIWFTKKQQNNYLKIYETPETDEKFGLMVISGDMKEKILAKLKSNYSLQGDHIKSGGKASDLPMRALLSSGTVSLGVSYAASGQLFMATANPATLMAIGNGVGSAVMGAGGIVAQAPFIALKGAIMPVVAPLLVFQAITTVMLLERFEKINEKLISIEKSINRVLQRQEATLIGEILSAYSRLDNLEKEFRISNQFTDEMIIRLALLEDKVNPILERYKYLYEARDIDNYLEGEDAKYKQFDAHLVIILTMLDLRVDVLRIKLTIQENPAFMNENVKILVQKVERYQKLWSDIESSPKRIDEVAQELQETIDSMNLWGQHMPGWLGGKRKERKILKNQLTGLIENISAEKAIDIVESAKDAAQIGESILEHKEPMSLIYWEDEQGKHSYYTNDIEIT